MISTHKKFYIYTGLCLFTLGLHAQEEQLVTEDHKGFYKLPSSETGIIFQNNLQESKQLSFLTYETIYNGAGVGIGDVNNDGLPDLYFCGNQVGDKLYLNQGNMRFVEITEQAGILHNGGWSSGVSLIDLNRDGWLDIYVNKTLYDDQPHLRANEMYINQGNGTFKELAEELGLADTARSQQTLFFDYDGDDDFDVFQVNQPPNPALLSPLHGRDWLKPQFGCRLLENQDGRFVDVTEKAGVFKRGYGLNASVADFNKDGWLDIYVCNDYEGPDFLYMNQGNGTFKNTIDVSMNHISNFSMGSDVGDINNDGLTDLIVLDMVAEDNYRMKANMSGMQPEKFWSLVAAGGHYQYMYNTLQLNLGTDANDIVHFSEIGQMAGVSNTDWSWSPLIFDFDNDGFKDIFVSNGIYRDLRFTDALKKTEKYLKKIATKKPVRHLSELMDEIDFEEVISFFPSSRLPNYFYHNNGDYQLTNKARKWGVDEGSFSTGAAVGDLDGDGDLDLVINNVNDPAFIYENKTTDHYFLQVECYYGTRPLYVPGTEVSIYSNGKMQTEQVRFVRGFYSSSDPLIHFGLSHEERIDSLVVVLPGGRKKVVKKELSINQRVKVDLAGAVIQDAASEPNEFFFHDITKEVAGDISHQENPYDDFAREILLPHKLSTLGPALASADVNGDGHIDLFLGGAVDQPGVVILQDADGHLRKTASPTFTEDAAFEDVGAAFFDADQDGDMDLYVVSGGNEYSPQDPRYQDRLYLNNSRGQFSRSQNVLPDFYTSGSVVKPCDYDQDGDTDLLITGRLVPGRYPEPATSTLLQNQWRERGELTFEDVTKSQAPELDSLGMVTDAVWTDLNGDGQVDLMLVGMWMAPTPLIQESGEFSIDRKDEKLGQQTGWWYCVTSADLDRDGDDDYILGNLGLNYKYKASMENPFAVYYDDFDANGKKDIVLSYYNFGELYPLRGRSCSSQQIPTLAESFPTYDIFASSDLEEIYGRENLEAALHLEANTFASLVLENQGDGTFMQHPLPMEVQFSNINDVWAGDLDSDGWTDLILVHNMFGSEVETPRADAGMGLYLRGDAAFSFQVVNPQESGLFLTQECKKIVSIDETDPTFVIAVNDGPLKVLKAKIHY